MRNSGLYHNWSLLGTKGVNAKFQDFQKVAKNGFFVCKFQYFGYIQYFGIHAVCTQNASTISLLFSSFAEFEYNKLSLGSEVLAIE